MLYFDKKGELIIDDEPQEEMTIEEKEKLFRYDLFKDILRNILESNEPLEWNVAKKTYSAFVINRCLANQTNFLGLALAMNQYGSSIKPELHYKLLQKIIQPKRIRFLGYFKENKATKDIKAISTFFNISVNETQNLLTFLSDKDVKYILKNITNFETDKVTRR